ncbi:hypothetical protein JD969_00435 [Planctomycetota bacterium]|nr:hypothetical protein JD969_00435 [Planctomycetota bacterium]
MNIKWKGGMIVPRVVNNLTNTENNLINNKHNNNCNNKKNCNNNNNKDS